MVPGGADAGLIPPPPAGLQPGLVSHLHRLRTLSPPAGAQGLCPYTQFLHFSSSSPHPVGAGAGAGGPVGSLPPNCWHVSLRTLLSAVRQSWKTWVWGRWREAPPKPTRQAPVVATVTGRLAVSQPLLAKEILTRLRCSSPIHPITPLARQDAHGQVRGHWGCEGTHCWSICEDEKESQQGSHSQQPLRSLGVPLFGFVPVSS